MNRILKRPMFRIGGSTGTGITSGLDQPKGQMASADMDMKIKKLTEAFMEYKQRGGTLSFEEFSTIYAEENFNSGGRVGLQVGGSLGPGTLPGFLTGLGINLASATPRGNIFATTAEAAKDPFEKFQTAQFAEGQSEKEFERDVELQMLKNLDEDSRSAIMKQAEEGFEAGLYSSVNEGVRRLLQTKEFGVADRPGEKRQENIDSLVDIALRQPGMDAVRDEPIIRNQITVVQDYKTLEENNPEIDFAAAPLLIIEEKRKDYEPGKVYYSGEENKFYVFNGPEAEQPFTLVDVKR